MLHVERADGIFSKPQLDHPEKMPLLSQPLSFNTRMGGPKSPESRGTALLGLTGALEAVKKRNAT